MPDATRIPTVHGNLVSAVPHADPVPARRVCRATPGTLATSQFDGRPQRWFRQSEQRRSRWATGQHRTCPSTTRSPAPSRCATVGSAPVWVRRIANRRYLMAGTSAGLVSDPIVGGRGPISGQRPYLRPARRPQHHLEELLLRRPEQPDCSSSCTRPWSQEPHTQSRSYFADAAAGKLARLLSS